MPTVTCAKTLKTALFADAFRASMPLPAALDPHFEEALRHIVDNPGSLVRPRMVYQVAMAYGLDEAPARNLAIALEYFHTASLIFDDLPSMDNASERRGVPCVHLAYGEAGAILALSLIHIFRQLLPPSGREAHSSESARPHRPALRPLPRATRRCAAECRRLQTGAEKQRPAMFRRRRPASPTARCAMPRCAG